MNRILLLLLLVAGCLMPGQAAEPPTTDAFLLPSADEPLLKTLSLPQAAASLDRISLAWVEKHQCGLVVYVLRQAGVPAGHAAIQRGKTWLASNQRTSGRWFTRSLNGIKQHYISDTATAFAVLALNACE